MMLVVKIYISRCVCVCVCVCMCVWVCVCDLGASPHIERNLHLQHTATHCNTLEHTATPATYYNTLQHVGTHCNNCNILQHIATHCNTLQHTATHCRHTWRVERCCSIPRTSIASARCDLLTWMSHVICMKESLSHMWLSHAICMGWLRLVGSLKLQVSFAKSSIKETIFCKRDL